jgi:hypothetical protein
MQVVWYIYCHRIEMFLWRNRQPLFHFSRYLLAGIFVLLLARQSAAIENITRYKDYQKLTGPTAQDFLNQGLQYLKEIRGSINYSVHDIDLRLSILPFATKGLPEKFAATAINDEGKAVIFLSSKPEDGFPFYGQLGHEIFHLVNPEIMDSYMEGLATLFSEKLMDRLGHNWRWCLEFFKKGGDPFYGQTYFMVRDIEHVVGWKKLLELPEYWRNVGRQEKQIDIDAWMDSLIPAERATVTKIISKYSSSVNECRKTMKKSYAFAIPYSYYLTILPDTIATQ